MYRKKIKTIIPTGLFINKSVEGETIEEKVERIVNNKEPITDGAPPIYTERKDGVVAGYDIRTDRFEVALSGMDKVSKSTAAKRQARLDVIKGDSQDAKGESIQGTNENKG